MITISIIEQCLFLNFHLPLESIMSKEQKSNKETKKPKKDASEKKEKKEPKKYN
jgi:hypothetical protein